MTATSGRTAVATVENVAAAAYTLPTDGPEADGTLAWDSTTVVVVTVTAGGETGTGWTYGAAAATDVVTGLLAGLVVGSDPMDITATVGAMRRAARNVFVPGLVTTAISAVDVALWDLKAKLLGTSVVRLLGRVRDCVPLYGSGGFTTYDEDKLRAQLRGWVEGEGIRRVKIKIGEDWGGNEERDLHRMGVARQTVGPDVELFVDANGGYGVKQAVRVAREARELDVRWFEEPVSSDDLAGLAMVRSMVHPEVTAGEYGTDPRYFRAMCASGAVDCLQVDATRCGGYTGFLAAAAIADVFGLDVSAHCAPLLHAHVVAAVPNLRHVEWFADHVRVDHALFDGVLDPEGGCLRPDPDRPGHGVTLAESASLFRTR